jgi:hypothetical protein
MTLHVVILGGWQHFFFFTEPGLKFDENLIENTLKVQEFLVKCLFWVVAITLIAVHLRLVSQSGFSITE